MKNTITGILLGIIFIIVGIASTIYGVSHAKNQNLKEKEYIETEGTVINHRESDSEDETFAIVVEYQVGNQKYQKTSSEYTSSPKQIGSKVIIKYNPTNPSEAIFKGDKSSFMIILIGVAFTVCGIIAEITTLQYKNKIKNITYDNTDINQVSGPNPSM